MRLSKIIMILFFWGGLALLVIMVRKVGLDDLLESFNALGPWIIPYLALRTLPILFHTVAWAACFLERPLPIRLWHLALISRAGSSINQVTPTATIG